MTKRTKITAAAIGVSLALASTAGAGSSASLSSVGSRISDEQVTVIRGIPDTGGVVADTDTSTNIITLTPKLWRTLTTIPAYNYMTTPWAVAIFAHELGHIVKGMSENDANCFAHDNLYRVARALGFGPHKAQVVTKLGLQDSRTFCP